ncbi:hypothetical protein CEW81_20280 [Kluyvera genomosp. 3]|uniref:Uncharacterized protein n=1 Tax=Kluyvera genomosp. 3 TaxID=2774055 RepID=A0A248KJT8_9ENTR|nr:hypothetical protein CEW81_20280 [Kluyvera genomosp. 3]
MRSRSGGNGDGFFFRLFCCLRVNRHAANRCGYYNCEFTQRVGWLSSFKTCHGYFSDEVNDNVNENYYYN